MLRAFSAVALLTSIAHPGLSLADPVPGPWEVVKVTQGITIDRRKIPGNPLHEFRGHGVVEASLARVIAVMDDMEHRPEWSERCKDSRVIAQIDDRTQIVYDRTGSPWPVTDRDAVLHAQMVVDLPEHAVRFEFRTTTDPRMPPQKGAVRMPFVRGHWVLKPVHDGAYTDVEYQVQANPGGAIPDWVANLVSKSLPEKTLKALREQVKKPRYTALAAQIADKPEYHELMSQLAVTR